MPCTMQNTHSLYFRLLVLIIGGLTQCLAMKHLTVMRGDTLTLTCRLKKHHTSSPVEWKNPENLSLFFNKIKAMKDKRTSLVALTNSKFSIRVTDIKFKDGGVYNCVRYNPEFSEKKFKVTVIDAPKLEKDEQGDKTIVTCTASANEHPPSLSWLIDNGVEIEALPNYEGDNVTKKYTAVSHLNVKSTTKRVRVTCLAHHPALYHFYLENSIYLGSQSEDTLSKNPKYPSTTPDTTVITTLPSSTSEDTSTSSKYPSPTLGTTDTKFISNLFSSTSFTSSHSQSESTDYSNTTVAVAETTEDISSNDSANVLSNTTANESISETTEGTPSNTSITSSSDNNGNYSSHERQSIKKGNSALLVLLVTCLIICLFVVLVFFLVRLRKAHIAWKKENEESEQSVESSKSKSSSEEKQKQRRQGFWNTSFTKYKAEEPLENGAQATSASVQVVNENPQDFISRSGIKETEL
ncbi:cytotoxic and regulatory T-cell molecule [Clarias gariepinus]|uniref:cytotoxic and regulatory T-cell molecule n=1 Tax=Clarias gariepinus TaxID=13013 RepID=UPI00234C3864|nr:cytotoxic and regulatory T-cell molecule [Clarias gariepinus]